MSFKACPTVTTRLTMALERLECPSKLIKRCLNQSRKALERLKLPFKFTNRCLNQANKGPRKMERLSVCTTGASLRKVRMSFLYPYRPLALLASPVGLMSSSTFCLFCQPCRPYVVVDLWSLLLVLSTFCPSPFCPSAFVTSTFYHRTKCIANNLYPQVKKLVTITTCLL